MSKFLFRTMGRGMSPMSDTKGSIRSSKPAGIRAATGLGLHIGLQHCTNVGWPVISTVNPAGFFVAKNKESCAGGAGGAPN